MKMLKRFFNKLLGLNKNSEYINEAVIQDIYLNIGDIVKCNNNIYCIANENEEHFLCIPVNIQKLISADFLKLSDLRFENMIWISKEADYKLIDSMDQTKKLAMIKRYKNYLDEEIKRFTKQRGSVVSKANEYFYIYGEESHNWLLFKITKEEDLNKSKIKISDYDFYANFDESLAIDKKDETYNVELLATKEEINQIKLLKKSYRKELEKRENRENKELSFSSIVCLKNNFSRRYFVIKVYSDSLLVVSYENILNGLFVPEILRNNEIEHDFDEFSVDLLSYEILKEMSNKNFYSKPSNVEAKIHR